MITYWKSKRIEDCTREDLLECIRWQEGRMKDLEKTIDNHREAIVLDQAEMIRRGNNEK